jgi:hypothetical protein
MSARCDVEPSLSALHRYKRAGCRCRACVEAKRESQKAWRDRDGNRERENAARRKNREPTERPCAECGETFLATNPKNVICSRSCKDVRRQRRHREAYEAKIERRRERRRAQMRALRGSAFVDLAGVSRASRGQ